MSEPEEEAEVPEGAAVFPLIPPELGVHPLLLATLHATVFLIGSTDDVVQCDAAEESAQYLLTYLHRLEGAELQRVHEDIACLIAYAKQESWPEQDLRFLETFLTEFGIGGQGPENGNEE
jgi:hypothetical protein